MLSEQSSAFNQPADWRPEAGRWVGSTPSHGAHSSSSQAQGGRFHRLEVKALRCRAAGAGQHPKRTPVTQGQTLLAGAAALAAVLTGHKGKLPAPLITLLSLIGPGVVNEAANMAKDSLQKINADALAKRDNLTAT